MKMKNFHCPYCDLSIQPQLCNPSLFHDKGSLLWWDISKSTWNPFGSHVQRQTTKDALEADNIHPVISPNRSYGFEGGLIFMDAVFVVGDMDPYMHWDHMGSFPLLSFLSPQMVWIIPMATLRSWRKLPFLVDPFQIALTTMPSSWSMEGHLHIQA